MIFIEVRSIFKIDRLRSDFDFVVLVSSSHKFSSERIASIFSSIYDEGWVKN